MWFDKFTTTYDQKELINRLISKQLQLDTFRPLPTFIVQKIKENLSLEWTYNSNAIEGNTITLRETQLILQEGITVKGKSLREHFETFNHDKAINYLYQLVDDSTVIREIDILNLHSIVLNNIEEHYAGRIRNAGVRINGANFTPPNANKVSDLFDELITFVNTNPLNLDVVSLATIFHHRFVWIHPFFDGNGRTVRLAMNLILMRAGFPPAIILKTDRKKYYEALSFANNGNYDKLLLLILQSVERTLNIYLSSLPGTDLEYDSIHNIVSEERVPYGKEYISLLARSGKIDAYKEGNVWYTSEKAINSYVSSRKRERKLNVK
jgi:Fic family protein